MSVNPKERKMLQAMWAGAEDATGADLPDGTYQFKILSARFHFTDKAKPTFKTKIKVTGGDQEYLGKELEINDNLETGENMGWFKRKLRRLNITVTEDMDDIIDGAVAGEMEGKVFEGQVKTKNDFVNVYVNRLISEGSATDEKTDDRDEKEEAEDKEEKTSGLSEGDKVTWGDGKTGELVEILEDEGKARVRLQDNSVVRVKLGALSLAEADEAEEKEETEEKEESDEVVLPDPEDVEDMKAPAIRTVLKGLGFDPSDIKDPRGVLKAFAALAADPDAKIELSEVKPLADALDIKVEKGTSIKATLKQLAKAVEKRLS